MAKTFKSDQQGNFALEGMPSGTEVGFEVDDDRFAYDTMSMRVKIDNKGGFKPVNCRLIRGTSISGVVTRQGKPVAGMAIAAQGHKHSDWGETVTDSQGNYTIKRLMPEDYNVAARLTTSQESEFTVRAKEKVTTREGEETSGINLVVEPGGILSGIVADPSGKPIPNGSVGIFGPAHPQSTAWVQGVTADKQGHFRTRVPSGNNKVYYMGPGDIDRPMVDVQVKDGMESKVQVVGAVVSIPAPRPDEDSKVVAQTTKATNTHERKFIETHALWKGSMADSSILLKDGSRARLLYLCQGKGDKIKIWWPEGNLRTEEEYYQDLAAADYYNTENNGGSIFARIRLEERPNESDSYMINSDFVGMWTSTTTKTPRGKHRSELLVSLQPKGQSMINFKMGVPLGQYLKLGSFMVTYTGKGESGKIFKVTKFKNDRQEVEMVLPKGYAEKDFQMKAFDNNGKALVFVSVNSAFTPMRNGMVGKTFTFRSPNKISRIEVSYREVQWIEFKDINMKPVTQ